MNHLRRELAPITEAAWAEIDLEASRSLKHFLAGRKLIEVTDPSGWKTSSIDLGHVETIEGPTAGVEAARRQSQALVELRTPFKLSLAALDDAERGARDLDLDVVVDAARVAALAEDVTDYATFAWVCDVIVEEEYRGNGLGIWMMETVLADPQLRGVRRWTLATRNAHRLYARIGFIPLAKPGNWMEIRSRPEGRTPQCHTGGTRPP